LTTLNSWSLKDASLRTSKPSKSARINKILIMAKRDKESNQQFSWLNILGNMLNSSLISACTKSALSHKTLTCFHVLLWHIQGNLWVLQSSGLKSLSFWLSANSLLSETSTQKLNSNTQQTLLIMQDLRIIQSNYSQNLFRKQLLMVQLERLEPSYSSHQATRPKRLKEAPKSKVQAHTLITTIWWI